MGVDGLTIFHIKSHLQKYRLNIRLPDDGTMTVMSDTGADSMGGGLEVEGGGGHSRKRSSADILGEAESGEARPTSSSRGAKRAACVSPDGLVVPQQQQQQLRGESPGAPLSVRVEAARSLSGPLSRGGLSEGGPSETLLVDIPTATGTTAGMEPSSSLVPLLQQQQQQGTPNVMLQQQQQRAEEQRQQQRALEQRHQLGQQHSRSRRSSQQQEAGQGPSSSSKEGGGGREESARGRKSGVTRKELEEALLLQMELQKKLHEQLEVGWAWFARRWVTIRV